MRQTGWGYAYAHRHGTCVLLGGVPIPSNAIAPHRCWRTTRDRHVKNRLRLSRATAKAAMWRVYRGRETDGTTADCSHDGPGPTPPRVAPGGPRRQCRPVHLGAVSSPGPLGRSNWATQAWRYPARARPGSAAL